MGSKNAFCETPHKHGEKSHTLKQCPRRGEAALASQSTRILSLTLSRSLRVFCRFLHLLKPGVRVLHKHVFALQHVHFDFLSFIDKACRILSERLSVYDTVVQRIWLYFFLLVSSKCKGAEERNQPEQEQGESCPEFEFWGSYCHSSLWQNC